MHQILVLAQLEVFHLVGFTLLLLLQSFLGLHRANSADLLVCLNSRLLESLDGFLQFPSDSGVFSGELYDAAESVLCLYPQFAQFIVELVEFRVIGDVQLRNLHFVFLCLIVDGDQTAVLPLFLHFLEYLYEKFELLLQFLCRTANQRW